MNSRASAPKAAREEMLYVVILLIALLAIYFLFLRKPEAPPQAQGPKKALEPPSGSKESQKPAPRAEPATTTRGEPAAPSPPGAGASTTPGGGAAAEQPPAAEAAPAPAEPQRTAASSPGGRTLLSRRADVDGLRRGLTRSREAEGFFGRLKSLFAGKAELPADVASQIEEVLLASDVGVKATAALLARVKDALGRGEHLDAARVWEVLREEARHVLEAGGKARALELRAQPTVVLFVGVNGAGKTTTIGKLATKLKEEGHKCVLAAGDTFRAAAVQQLTVWGSRIGCEVVRGKDGADPGSVVFDAIEKAKSIGADVVLADTAGRLHTKTNLMTEMQKIARTAGKAMEGAPHEVLLVIDATNGQNAMAQAREFKAALPLSGVVLTKLDGTAKGGVILGIAEEIELPVRFVGLGERPDDLHEFSPGDFVEALLGSESEPAGT